MAHLCAGNRLSWGLAGVEEEEECEGYTHHQDYRNTIPGQREIYIIIDRVGTLLGD